MIPIPIPIPAKNRIITSLIVTVVEAIFEMVNVF